MYQKMVSTLEKNKASGSKRVNRACDREDRAAIPGQEGQGMQEKIPCDPEQGRVSEMRLEKHKP